ncbi:MAG: hypothetical protein AAFU64_12005, partial [Bacteroidota bacterium]
IIRDSSLFYFFSLPEKYRAIDLIVSENDSIFKRIFISKEINQYASGVYLLNKNSCEDEYNCWEQLSLWTRDSVKVERELLLKILNSVEFQ